MIWENYVYRRGAEVEDLWDQMFDERRRNNSPSDILYITGRGFDVRAEVVMSKFVDRLAASKCQISKAELLMLEFSGYELSEELRELTEENASAMETIFSKIGNSRKIAVQASTIGDDEASATSELRSSAGEILSSVGGQTDIVVDVSSLPRIVYLTIVLSILAKLLPNGASDGALLAGGVTFHILVGEDAALDSKISSEDPSNDLVLIPGYSAALQSETLERIPVVWFPLLGENRAAQLAKIEEIIPSETEVCPVLPHPSRDPRRGDRLLIEYEKELFVRYQIPLTNIIYVHETHPFEVYRQLLLAMKRYQETMHIVGGCRIAVTPLSSKLITLGAALACFEMRLLSTGDASAGAMSSVAIPYAEPRRYVADVKDLQESQPEIAAILLTGDAYALA